MTETTGKRCAEALSWLSTASFRFRPKTPEPLERASALAQCFEGCGVEERAEVLQRIRGGLGPKLLTLSGFMAEAAMNSRDTSWIRSALIMHVVEDFAQDYRENIRYLVLVAHAARKLRVDLREVAKPVLPLASLRARARLEEFLARDERSNDLAGFGIREDIVEGESRFIPG
jgi:hypothetical protein